ncbi:MAG: hypothetical protein ACRCZ4_00515 [Plesiomonas sp.]|uniref:hypothetical protein n=1 Tax=Plesiomonas sp. TaxID=2486279 RepID=UPI003F34A78F
MADKNAYKIKNADYYIYIDTKILGAVEQLIDYFNTQVFNREDCIYVICKYYKSIERLFKRKFDDNKIAFKFIRKHSDINLIDGKVIFYLFNAQSNCRVVANQSLIHIFVTHGESHKLASIKPIIRIYDYIITSGQVGIDRYLKSGLFSESDINNGKVITLGNTFIGRNEYIYNENSLSLVYAPTWEGGIPEEDYCSISRINTLKIILFCQKNKINTIYLQPHPNLGHRIKSKKNDLSMMINKLEDSNLTVKLIKKESVEKIFLFFKKIKASNFKKTYLPVKYALTDISAMEVQFISKGIPCGVFKNDEIVKTLTIPKSLNTHYISTFIPEDEMEIKKNNLLDKEYYKYFLSYPLGLSDLTPYRDRINWLCHYATLDKNTRIKKLKDKF